MKRKERLSIQGLVNYSRSPHTAPWPRMLQFFPKLDLWPWLKVPQKPPLTKSHLMYVCRKKNTQSTNFNYYICKILKDFVYLYVCLSHLCVYVCTCTHMHACLYTCMWKSQANFGIHSSNVIHLVFIKWGVPLAWGLLIQWGSLAGECRGDPCLCLPSAEITGTHHRTWLFMGCWRSNVGPRACPARVLPWLSWLSRP